MTASLRNNSDTPAKIPVTSILLFTSSSASPNSTRARDAVAPAEPSLRLRTSDRLAASDHDATTRAHGSRGRPAVFFSACSLDAPLQTSSTQNITGVADLFLVPLSEDRVESLSLDQRVHQRA